MMRKISHLQARRAIHSALSRTITPGERAALEAHLAGCADCRSEANRLDALESGLRRALHARLDVTPGPLSDPLAHLPTNSRRLTMKPGFSLSFGLALAVLLIGVAAALSWLLPRPAAVPGGPPVTGSPTPLVTPQVTPLARNQGRLPGGVQGLALFGMERDGNNEIYLLDASGKKYNLTQRPANDRFPAWSPDGERIAFFSDGEGAPGQREVFLMNADGSGLRQLTHTPAGEGWLSSIAWSPEGKLLALIHFSGVTGQSEQGVSFEEVQLYLVETGDGTATPLNNDQRHGLPGEAVWSPDGSRIAFTRGLENGGDELRVIRLDSPTSVKMAAIQERFTGPVWSPDGKRLAYITHGPWIADNWPYRLAENVEAQLFVQSVQGGEAQMIYEFDRVPANLQLIGWAPDGSRLLFLTNEGVEDCWQMQSILPDGAGLTTLPFCAALPAGRPVWTQDGWLLFPATAAGDGQDYAVFALDPSNVKSIRQLATVRLVDGAQMHIRPGLRMKALASYASPLPTTMPASTQPARPGALVLPPQSICYEAMKAVSEQLKLGAQIEYDAPFTNADPIEARPTETGRGCEIRWEGPMSYANLQEVFDKITPWVLNDQKYTTRSLGTSFRHWWAIYQQSYRVAQIEASWQPLHSEACPDQDAASDCSLPAEQKWLEVTLRLADDPLTQAIDEILNHMFTGLAGGEAQALESLLPDLREQVKDLAGLNKALGIDPGSAKIDFTFEVRSATEDRSTVVLTVWQRFGRTREWLSERLVDLRRQGDGWGIEAIRPSPP